VKTKVAIDGEWDYDGAFQYCPVTVDDAGKITGVYAVAVLAEDAEFAEMDFEIVGVIHPAGRAAANAFEEKHKEVIERLKNMA
jgi:hypothetical protein